MTTEPTQPLTEGTGKTDTPGVLAVETVAIGPECFATKTGDVLCWRGRNYVPQDLHTADVRKFSDIVDELDAEVSRLRAENTALADKLTAVCAIKPRGRDERRTAIGLAEANGWNDAVDAIQAAVNPCECSMTDPSTWTTYGGLTEPGSAWEWNPDCPAHGDPTARALGVGDNEKGETDGEA